jgi:hypothetical protein
MTPFSRLSTRSSRHGVIVERKPVSFGVVQNPATGQELVVGDLISLGVIACYTDFEN